jgi:hypothetical protein
MSDVTMSDEEQTHVVVNSISLNSYPLCFHNTLLESELDQRECSDSIYLSNDRFRYFNNTDSEELVIIKITKGSRSTYANITGIHSEERNMIFMPTWMCAYLGADCGDNVSLSRLRDYRTGMNIRIQPHTSEYAKLEDPASALRNAFENYTVLQSGIDIPLQVAGSLLVVSIIDTHNVGPVCIRGVELYVEIDRPLDSPPEEVNAPEPKRARYNDTEANSIVPEFEEQKPEDFDSMFPTVPVEDKRFPGKGNVLGAKR